MKPLTYHVLKLLADGDFHSGALLAKILDVSRGSVWHAVQELEAAGLDIYRVPRRGYRLQQSLSLLDRAQIERHLGRHAGHLAVEVVDSVHSTNTLALERARADAPSGTVIVAEWQTAGRGRLGRAWQTGIGGALTFSLVWRFRQGAGLLSGLSLAIGVALMRALHGLGAGDARLKWPNDIVWHGRKLAGILIEMQGDALGPSCAVIGIGVNVRLSDALKGRIGQATVDLESICGRLLDRNAALGQILVELALVLNQFAREGFAPLRGEWQRHHVWQGRRVTVRLPDGRQENGVVRGVGIDGALILGGRSGVRRYHSGEVSLRLAVPGSAERSER